MKILIIKTAVKLPLMILLLGCTTILAQDYDRYFQAAARCETLWERADRIARENSQLRVDGCQSLRRPNSTYPGPEYDRCVTDARNILQDDYDDNKYSFDQCVNAAEDQYLSED